MYMTLLATHLRGALRFRISPILLVGVGFLAGPFLAAEAQQDTLCLNTIEQYDTAKVHYDVNKTAATLAALRTARSTMFGCIDTADDNTMAAAVDQVGPEGSRLTRGFFSIPEYHDEGRLPTVANRLGPMAHIYASPFLGGFRRRQQIYEQGSPGLLAAIVVVESEGAEPAKLPTTYQNLGLELGVNCVWLFLRDTMPNTEYKAFVSTAAKGRPCSRRDRRRGPLSVVAVQHKDFTDPSDYPPVARFDLDVSGNVPVMAFKCLAAFCEVGPRDPAHVRAPWDSNRPNAQKTEWDFSGATGNYRRARVIKGWHDEQYLAERYKGEWIRRNIRATVTPVPAVDTLDASDFLNKWVEVAMLTIHDEIPATSKYYRWGLTKGDNAMWLRYDGKVWNAMIRRDGQDKAGWIHVGRMVHFDAAVPPTARFRWTRIDDGVWVPCGGACCRSDGGGT